MILDYELLRRLPKEGARVGLREIGRTVKDLARELGEIDSEIKSSTLNSRVRVLKHHGLIVDVVTLPITEGRGWQITSQGEQALATHDTKEAQA